ncbi:MAG: glycosyltransferase family 4 protein [Gemmatimonadota bacterium]
MRVVFLTHNFPRFPGDLSGAFLATLAHALIARGHDIRVLAPSDLGETGPGEFEGIPVTRVRYASSAQETVAYRGNMADAIRHPAGWKALVGLWRSLRRAAGIEVEQGADLVHAHWWVPGGLASPPNVPLVLTVHGTDGALLGRSSLARWVAAPVFRRARIVTTVSRTLAEQVTSATGRVVPDSHIHAMPIEVSLFERWSEGGQGLIVISRLTPQKRVDLALGALAVLRNQGRDIKLRIIGDGQERATLEERARSLSLGDAVMFAGAVPPSEIPGLLAHADAMVFPAQGEGFGLGAAEALMAGVPVVVCSDGGGVLEIVPESGAGRVSPPDPAALAESIGALLDNPESKAQARILGESWRRKLAPDHVAAACESWYREAAGV